MTTINTPRRRNAMKARTLALLAALAISATPALTADAACTCGRGCACGSRRAASCQNCRASQIAPTADIPAGYPLKTCIVSGKPLAESEHRIVYTHMQAGRPDRTVVLYDSKSLVAFKKSPAKYLAKLDAAEAK